jgi:hypothetical protein
LKKKKRVIDKKGLFRADDSSPSFKVDDELNLWQDHGLACGGNT